MSEWDTQLVFIDGKSNKYWRAKAQGTDLVVNWGKIGTDGQTQVKSFSDEASRDREHDKLASSKRKKGYVDGDGGGGGGSAAPPAPAATSVLEDVPNSLTLGLDKDGRKVELKLELEDASLTTTVAERFGDADAARAALLRIKQALEADGYR